MGNVDGQKSFVEDVLVLQGKLDTILKSAFFTQVCSVRYFVHTFRGKYRIHWCVMSACAHVHLSRKFDFANHLFLSYVVRVLFVPTSCFYRMGSRVR